MAHYLYTTEKDLNLKLLIQRQLIIKIISIHFRKKIANKNLKKIRLKNLKHYLKKKLF